MRPPATLSDLAEDPPFCLESPEGAERIADDRSCVVIGPERRWADVCRLRLPDEPAALGQVVSEIRELVTGIEHVVWNVGSSATPVDLPLRLRALGLRDPDPPFEPVVTAMVLTEEPTTVPAVEVRRIRNLDDHLVGLEIVLAADAWTEQAAAAERDRAEETFRRRTRRGSLQWLAMLSGVPAAFAFAERGPCGLYLAGGATLPQARGRGCYRALVRARWDEAVRLGMPGLAVQAQLGSSAPILRHLGFVDVATIHTLQS